jgi:hypothetical protein
MKKIFLLLFLLYCAEIQAQEATTIIIRAKSKDAKFIGTSMGGARVNIHNSETGELLATGLISGTTGNTDLIMHKAHERGQLLSDDATAKFETSLLLEKPVFANVEVIAPLGQKQATVKSSTQLWLIPGKHLLGDGIVLEFPGFVVDIQEPGAQSFIKANQSGSTEINLQAHVVMMCGCTITDGGLWDANKFEVKAIIYHNSKTLSRVDLKLTKDNQFNGQFKVTEKGIYEVHVYAYDATTNNTGLDKTSFIIN